MELIRGKELAQKILDQITEHPETHDQDTWENVFGECGTTYCIAGWAVAFNARSTEDRSTYQARILLADELGLTAHWSTLGQELLGLDDQEAEDLFYSGTEEAPAMLAELFELEYTPESGS